MDVNFLHIIAYLRKSRADGDMSVESVLEKHEQILNDYCIREFGQTLSEQQIYREVMSGESIDARPLFQQLLTLVKQGSVSAVLVVDLQRLSRGDLSEIGTISNIFNYSNVPIITPTHTYNLHDKYDRKIFEMEVMHGNDYLEYTKEILHRGMVNSAKQGNYMSTYAPFGYTKVFVNKKPTLVVDPLCAPVVREIYSRYIDGDSLTAIAESLTERSVPTPRNKRPEWNRMTVYAILNNPTYTGIVTYGKTRQVKVYDEDKLVKKHMPSDEPIVTVGKFEPIISNEVFMQVKNKMPIPVKREVTDLRSPLTGLMRCADCHDLMMFTVKQDVVKVRHKTAQGNCKCSECRESVVLDMVITALKQTLDNLKVTDKPKIEKVDYTAQINALKKKREKIIDYLIDGRLTQEEFDSRAEKIQNELNLLTKKQQEEQPQITPEEYSLSLHDCLDQLDSSVSNKIKNKFLRTIINCIYYNKTKDSSPSITIVFN